MEWSKSQADFMNKALEVAERGRGKVSPNPLVGCVLVKDGQVIAEGWHETVMHARDRLETPDSAPENSVQC